MNDVSIRTATAADIAAITRIYAHAVEHGTASFELEPPDEAEMARRQQALLARNFPYIVAELAGAVAGYAYAGPYRDRRAYDWCVEDLLYIAPELHRKGIGRLLLTRLIAESEARGFRQMIGVIGDFGQYRVDCGPCRGRLPAHRQFPIDRLQARPLARHRADAARARQRRFCAAVTRLYPATTRIERSSAPSTRSSSWPRRRM